MADWLDLPFDDDPAPATAAPAPGPLTVSELSARLKSAIERSFASVLVEGEISNFRPSLLHAQGRRRADPRGDVPHERPPAHVPAR
jgi:hypothetical protein